jgi:hypothetical protein
LGGARRSAPMPFRANKHRVTPDLSISATDRFAPGSGQIAEMPACPSWVKKRITQFEHITSALPSLADIKRTCCNVRYVPTTDSCTAT